MAEDAQGPAAGGVGDMGSPAPAGGAAGTATIPTLPPHASVQGASVPQAAPSPANRDGNVRVGVRVRPMLPYEEGSACISQPSHNAVQIGTRQFTFDFAFPSATSQDALYSAAVEPLVDSCFEGYNVTILAYGQTGSGKTYTMGSANLNGGNEGIIPRFLKDVFDRMPAYAASRRFRCSASLLEIYNEEIKDLLDDTEPHAAWEVRTPRAATLAIRDDVDGVTVAGLTQTPVMSYMAALDVLRTGSARRTTAATLMNDVSSRSHAVFTLTVESLPVEDSPSMVMHLAERVFTRITASIASRIVSKLSFVDLAGSERLKRTGAIGERMREGISINSGLLVLGNVINALADDKRKEKASHVPYRDSKLTRLLQDALGGNSRTLFIACVSPSDRNVEETLNTLRYANRARNIRNKATANVDPQTAALQTLRAHVQLLEMELAAAKFGSAASPESLQDPQVRQYLASLAEKAGAAAQSLNMALPIARPPTANGGLFVMDDRPRAAKATPPLGPRQQFFASPEPPFSLVGSPAANLAEEEDMKVDVQDMEVLEELLALERKEAEFQSSVQSGEAQMNDVDSAITSKMALLETLKQRLQHYQDIAQKYGQLQAALHQMESEREQLVKELESLSHKPPMSEQASDRIRGRLAQLEKELDSLRSQRSQTQKLMQTAARETKRAKDLEAELEKLKVSKVKLAKKQHEDAQRHQSWIATKTAEIEALKKAERNRVRQISSLQLEARRSTMVAARKNNLVQRMSSKLKATEEQLLKLLQRQRTTKGTLAGRGRRSLGADVTAGVSLDLAQRVEARKQLIDSEISSRVAAISAEEKLSVALDERAKLLQQLMQCVARREELAAQEEAGTADEETRDALEATEQELEGLETQIALVDARVEEASASVPDSALAVMADMSAAAGTSLELFSAGSGPATPTKPQEPTNRLERLLADMSLEEAQLLLKSIVLESVELHGLAALAEAKRSEAEAAVAAVELEKQQCKQTLATASRDFAKRAAELRLQFENDLLALLDEQTANDDGRATNSAVSVLRHRTQEQLMRISELKTQVEAAEAAAKQQSEAAAEFQRQLMSVQSELKVLQASVADAQPDVAHTTEELSNLWNELGVEPEQQQQAMQLIVGAVQVKCQEELQQLMARKQQAEATMAHGQDVLETLCDILNLRADSRWPPADGLPHGLLNQATAMVIVLDDVKAVFQERFTKFEKLAVHAEELLDKLSLSPTLAAELVRPCVRELVDAYHQSATLGLVPAAHKRQHRRSHHGRKGSRQAHQVLDSTSQEHVDLMADVSRVLQEAVGGGEETQQADHVVPELVDPRWTSLPPSTLAATTLNDWEAAVSVLSVYMSRRVAAAQELAQHARIAALELESTTEDVLAVARSVRLEQLVDAMERAVASSTSGSSATHVLQQVTRHSVDLVALSRVCDSAIQHGTLLVCDSVSIFHLELAAALLGAMAIVRSGRVASRLALVRKCLTAVDDAIVACQTGAEATKGLAVNGPMSSPGPMASPSPDKGLRSKRKSRGKGKMFEDLDEDASKARELALAAMSTLNDFEMEVQAHTALSYSVLKACSLAFGRLFRLLSELIPFGSTLLRKLWDELHSSSEERNEFWAQIRTSGSSGAEAWVVDATESLGTLNIADGNHERAHALFQLLCGDCDPVPAITAVTQVVCDVDVARGVGAAWTARDLQSAVQCAALVFNPSKPPAVPIEEPVLVAGCDVTVMTESRQPLSGITLALMVCKQAVVARGISLAVQRLGSRMESQRKLMQLANEVTKLEIQMRDFELHAADKERLKGSSKQLMDEAKFRKTAATKYPRYLERLLREVRAFEEHEGQAFMIPAHMIEARLTEFTEGNKEQLMKLSLTSMALARQDAEERKTTSVPVTPIPATPPPAVRVAALGPANAANARAGVASALSRKPAVPVPPSTPTSAAAAAVAASQAGDTVVEGRERRKSVTAPTLPAEKSRVTAKKVPVNGASTTKK